MKNISVANMIETLTMSLQAGFVDTMDEIDALSSIVSGLGRRFEQECQETDTLQTEEVKEVISALESFLCWIVNDPKIDFIDEVDSHGICLSIVEILRSLGDLKSLLKF